MHPKSEEGKRAILYFGDTPLCEVGKFELPEITVAECPKTTEEHGVIGDMEMEVTFNLPKNSVCRGGKRRFEKLCRGVLGLERNEIKGLEKRILRANQEKDANQCETYAEMYRDMLLSGDFWIGKNRRRNEKGAKAANAELKKYAKAIYQQGRVQVQGDRIVLNQNLPRYALTILPLGVPGVTKYGTYIIAVGEEDIGVVRYQGMPKQKGDDYVRAGVEYTIVTYEQLKDIEFTLEYGEEGADGGDG